MQHDTLLIELVRQPKASASTSLKTLASTKLPLKTIQEFARSNLEMDIDLKNAKNKDVACVAIKANFVNLDQPTETEAVRQLVLGQLLQRLSQLFDK